MTVVPQKKISLNESKNFFEMAHQKQVVQSDSLHHVTTKSQDEPAQKLAAIMCPTILNKSEKKQTSRMTEQVKRPGSSYGVHKAEPRQMIVQSSAMSVPKEKKRMTVSHMKPRPSSGFNNHNKLSASDQSLTKE